MKILLVLFLFATARADGLEEKLNQQWQKYAEARALLLSRVGNTELPLPERLVSREEWEKILKVEFTAGELRGLRERQASEIRKSRERSVLESKLDLDSIRAIPGRRREAIIKEFCRTVPKGGMLHVHPFGTFNRETAKRLVSANQPILPVKEILDGLEASGGSSILYSPEKAWLSTLGAAPAYDSLAPRDQLQYLNFFFLPPGKHPFPRFNAVFFFLGSVMKTWEIYEGALFDFADRAVRHGVSYVEFSAGFHPNSVAILKNIEARNGLVIRLNQSFDRSRSPENLAEDTAKVLAIPADPYYVGIDLLDNEDGNPALEKGQMPYGLVLKEVLAGNSQLHRTMHSGEIGDERNPRDAMILGAERLGHGVNLDSDPVALEYAARHKIGVEVNLTSNLRLTKVQRVKDNPFLRYLRLGVPVSLSTDDEGIFDTDINRECELAVGETDITYAEFKRMALHSIETSFAAEEKKRELLAKLRKAFVEFERKR